MKARQAKKITHMVLHRPLGKMSETWLRRTFRWLNCKSGSIETAMRRHYRRDRDRGASEKHLRAMEQFLLDTDYRL